MSDDINMPERWHVLTIPGDCTVMGAISGEPPGVEVGTGWVKAPDEVARVTAMWEARGMPHTFGAAAPHLMRDSAVTNDEPVFFWKTEEKVLGKRLDAWNQKSVGSCFPAGTMIRKADGSHKPIETFLLLDEVVTAEGNTGCVTHLFARRHKGEMCTLVVWGHSHLQATPEHPILTRRGYVPIGKLTDKDWVAMPRYAGTRHDTIVPSEYFDTRRYANSGGERKFAGVAGRKATTVLLTPLPDVITLDADAGLIFGLFLAEGNTDQSKVVWTFNRNEKDTLVAELVTALDRAWGVKAHVQERGPHNTLKVVVYGTGWAKLFEGLCSTGAGQKTMHPDLSSGPPEFLRAVLNGWLSGDGYASRRNGREGKDQGVTVSHALAMDMWAIGTALGDRPAILRSEPKVSHGVKSRLPRWDVTYHSQGDNFRVELSDKYVWRKVRWVNREEYDGHVYNMEVEGDNSYVAEGIGVHNCVGFGTTRAVQNLLLWEIAAGEPEEWPGAELCPEITYAGSRHEVGKDRVRGDGSVGVWAAEFVMRYGVLPRGKYDGIDLTEYDEAMCRLLGNRGVPDALEPAVRQHPVTAAALVTTEEEAWAAIGAGKPIAVCSDQGFSYDLVDGFCKPQGSWNHCMHQCSRFVSPKYGPSGTIGNNWNGYLRGSREFEYVAADGSVKTETLPVGCFNTTMKTIGRMVAQKDSSAFAGLSGWVRQKVSYVL